jgi:hypothetical protein
MGWLRKPRMGCFWLPSVTNARGVTPVRYNVMVRKSGFIADRVPIALNTPLLRRTVGLSPKLAPKQ